MIIAVSLFWLAFLASIFADVLAPNSLTGNAMGFHLMQLALLATALVCSYKLQSRKVEAFRKRVSAMLGLNLPNSQHVSLETIEQSLEVMSKQLIESKTKESAIVRNAVDVIGLIDTNSCFVSVNPASESVLGYTANELIGHPISDFIHSEDLESSLEATTSAEKSIEKIVFENRWRRKDGSLVNLLWSAHWSASDSGLFCVVHDITERKIAETLLRESEERIRLILECLPISLFICNRVGLIEMSNSSSQKFSGYSIDDLFGKSMQILLPDLIAYGSPSAFLEFVSSTAKNKESRLRTKSGTSVPIELSMTEFSVKGDTKYITAIVDITERYELDKAKREFVAMVSHDLNSPLSNILITLSILKEGKLGEMEERALDVVEQAHDETQRLIELIKDLVDHEKYSATTFSMHFEEVSLFEIIQASVNAVRHAAEAKDLKITTPHSELKCQADSARLIQVMINLIGNAIKFAPAGSQISIEQEEIEGKGDKCGNGAKDSRDSNECNKARVTVTDSGPGIPGDRQDSIFEKFTQLNAKVLQENSGSGLGLAICKNIIEKHNGKIGVNSSSKGSTFWFEIPIKQGDSQKQ